MVINPPPSLVDVIGDALQLPGSSSSFTLVGYCAAEDILDFKLGAPRGQAMGYAVVLITEVLDEGGTRTFVLDKVETIDPTMGNDATESFTKLRRLSIGLSPVEDMKRTRSLDHILGDSKWNEKLPNTGEVANSHRSPGHHLMIRSPRGRM